MLLRGWFELKRSDFFIRLTTGVLFLAVASYIGVYFYNAMVNTFVTTIAVSYAIEETFPVQGYIVRTETVITDRSADVTPVAGEGERVASGQVIAVEYMSREALDTAGELRRSGSGSPNWKPPEAGAKRRALKA